MHLAEYDFRSVNKKKAHYTLADPVSRLHANREAVLTEYDDGLCFIENEPDIQEEATEFWPEY